MDVGRNVIAKAIENGCRLARNIVKLLFDSAAEIAEEICRITRNVSEFISQLQLSDNSVGYR